MSPAEAGLIDLEEPDWRERFEDHLAAHSALPGQRYSSAALERNLAQERAFERTLTDWQRFHATPIIVKGESKRLPAPAVDGVVALAGLKVFPPRSIDHKILPRGGPLFVEQHDAHCWLTVAQEAWGIRAIEDRILHLWRGEIETMTIDLSRAKWGAYCDKAVEFLRAAWPDFEKSGSDSCQGTSNGSLPSTSSPNSASTPPRSG